MKLSIESSAVNALLLMVPRVDVRYYLLGVCVDARASGDVTLVATDGHRMLAVPVPAADVEDVTPGQFIVPRDVLATVKPFKAGRTLMPLRLEITLPAPEPDPSRPGVMMVARATFTLRGATTATGSVVDGVYPDWRRVMPAKASGEVAVYQAAFIADFGIAARLLLGKEAVPIVHHNGDAGALVTGLGAALGVVMPVRIDRDALAHPGLPAWATHEGGRA